MPTTLTSAAPSRPKVFISYSRRDKKWLAELKIALKPLEFEGILECWDDSKIGVGANWKSAIRSAIDSSVAAVLLVSPHFLASDFIMKNELPPLLEAAEKRGLAVFPVILRPCRFKESVLADRMAINDPEEPLSGKTRQKRDEVWLELSTVVQTMLSTPPEVLDPGSGSSSKLAAVLPAATASISQQSPTREPAEDLRPYKFERGGTAEVRDKAILYRITSLEHAQPENILSGRSGINSTRGGRFHYPNQSITYCTDNILVAIAEVLNAMYRTTLNRLEMRVPSNLIRASVASTRALSIMPVHAIGNLAYLSNPPAEIEWGEHQQSLLVHPDAQVAELQKLSLKLREQNFRGAVYPSSRHSRGHCIALFQDNARALKASSYSVLQIRLQLLAEREPDAIPPAYPNPLEEILNGSQGYYEFLDHRKFKSLSAKEMLNPPGLPIRGIVDMFRTAYRRYPADAISETAFRGGSCPLAIEHCPFH